MAAETLSCPYCNSSVILQRPTRSGTRLRCPRCHELFPYHAGEQDQDPDFAASAQPAQAEGAFGDPADGPAPQRWSNRSVALVILSIMAAMATIGFVFAWITTDIRRQRDHPSETSMLSPSEVVSVAPAQLAALGYLPAGTEAIAAIHVAELMARPETASILRLMQADRANFPLHRLQQMSGLGLEDLDHVVLGVKMKDELLGRAFLVVQTCRPYDAAHVRAALKGGRQVHLSNKTVERIAPEQGELGGALWCANERTLVLTLQPKDLESVPTVPIAGVERFSTEIQKPLTGLPAGTQMWVVASAINWDAILFFLQALGLTDADRRTLSQVQGFDGWLRCQNEIRGQVEITCADATAATDLDKYLARKGLSASRFEKLAEDMERPGLRGLLAELARSLVRERNGERVQVRAQVSFDSVRRSLSRRAVGAHAAQE